MPRSLSRAKTSPRKGRDKPASKRGSKASSPSPAPEKKAKPAPGGERTASPLGEAVRPQGFSAAKVSGNGLSEPQLPEELYRHIVEAAQEGIWQVGADDRTVYVNPRVCEMLGYTPEEMVGHLLPEFFHPDWRDEGEVRRARHGAGTREQAETHFRRRDGSDFWALVSSIGLSGPGGEYAGSLGFLTDITERRRTQAAKYFLAAVVESSQDSIMTVDAASTITTWNKAAERLYGYSAAEAVGSPLTMLTLPEDLKRVLGNTDRVMHSKQVVKFDTVRVHKDRHEMNLEIVLSPVKNDSGEIVGVSCIARDISERKRLEGNLAFLADLSAAFAPHLGTEEVMAQVGEKLARHLGLARCAFSVVDDEADRITAIYEWRDDALPSVLGEYRISTLLTDAGRRHYRAGQLSVIRDAHDNPMLRVPPEILVKNRSNAIVDAPYLRDGQWKFLLTAARAEAGEWRSDESELVREVAARLYTRLERAWAEEALAESEEQYRSLFDSIDEGFILCEVVFDPEGRAVDLVYLVEANPAARRMMGGDYSGQRLSQTPFAGRYEPYWYEIWGRVAESGVPERHELYAGAGRAWYGLYVFKPEPANPDSRRIATVFQDISERKGLEANRELLVGIAQDLGQLSGEEEIIRSVGAKLAAHLGLSCYHYVDVDEERAEVTVRHFWHALEVPQVLGTYPISGFISPGGLDTLRSKGAIVINDVQTDLPGDPAARAGLKAGAAAQKIAAYVAVPYSQGGRWKAYFAAADSRPRRWTPTEVELIREVSNSVFPRIERARAEAALRESEAQLRAVVTLVPALLWQTDPAGAEISANPRWLEYTGQSLEESQGPGWLAAVHPEDAPNTARVFAEAFESQGPLEVEHRIRRWDGEYRWFLVRQEPMYGEVGEVVRWFGAATDIHDRRTAEERLRAAQHETESILSSIQDGFVAIDREWRYLRVNPEAARMLQRAPQEMLGRTVWEVFPSAAGSTFERLAREVMEHGVAQEFEEYLPPAGRWLNVRVYPAETGVTVAFRDIGERKRAEEALRASEEKYRTLSESQKHFVNDAAHELRAPLTAIQGNLELLERFRNMKKSDREAALSEVSHEAQRLSRLVNDMLALARGDSGGAARRREALRLDAVLKSAFAAAEGLKGNRALSLGALEPLPFSGDRDGLQQLGFILLENALKYTPEGGRVRLELRRDGGHAEFRVMDSGIGIAPQELTKVFERFYRSDQARVRGDDPGGTGLGLAIARQIVEAHGGQIWLESEPGDGTTAVVRLPLVDA